MKKRIIGLIGLMLLTANLFAGQVFYVTEMGLGKMDGSSWANAFADVQIAIDAAYNAGGGEVWIKAGTYKHGSAITMKNNVAIYGGFAGTETSKEQRVSGNTTILDGEGKYRVFYNNYSSSNPLTNSAKLDNVTIQNGYQKASPSYGGGIYNNYASPDITNCTFYKNGITSLSKEAFGGAIYYDNSSAYILNCTFKNNTSNSAGENAGGGAIAANNSEIKIVNCTLVENSVDGSNSLGGAIIFDENNSIEIVNCTFFKNSAINGGYVNGGAICIEKESSSCSITNCLFDSNFVNNGEYLNGDAICLGYLNVSITNSIFWNHESPVSGNFKSEFGTITADPMLLTLGDYGGSVQTCSVGAGSSAIGAGKVVDGVTTDARDVARSTTAPTIGAYEYSNKLAILLISTSEGRLKYPSNYEFTLNVYAEGTNLSYQWYKDGVAIDGAMSPSYTTSQSTGTSNYSVKVSDGTTTITSSEIKIETVDVVRYYVSTTGNDNNDGFSWDTAKRTYQAALEIANFGEEIWIAEGTYYPTDGDIYRYRWGGSSNAETRYFTFRQKSGVRVYGGFSKTGNPTLSERDPKKYKTIFSGNIGRADLETDNSYCVIYNTDALDDTTLIDGLIICDGYSNYKSSYYYPSAIKMMGGEYKKLYNRE